MRPTTMRGLPPVVGPFPLVVFAAMFGATAAGQLFGITADALALRHRVVWIPLACSVVLEAVVGARFGAAHMHRPLTWRECGRLSTYYSTGLAVVSLPLAAWTLASNPSLGGGASARHVGVAIVVVLAGFAAATALRQILMTLFSSRRS